MGSSESSTIKLRTNSQFKYLSTTTIPISNDYPLNQDPLRFFLRHKIDQEAKVKTLSDLQKETDRKIVKQKHAHNAENKLQSAQSNYGNCEEPHHNKFAPIPTIQIQRENKENQQSNQPTLNLKKSAFSARLPDTNSSFKRVSISPESFIKIREEPPTDYYEFQEMIGQGSYGQVFKAVCKTTHELRAIKVLKSKFMKAHQMKNFLAQMTLLSQLNHPSIVSLIDLFHFQRMHYVVMEYCDGGSVVEMMSKIPIKSELIIANIMKQLFRALSYMHSLNIIHRDIKLENIVFLNGKEGEKDYIPIKIIDFGGAVKSQYKVIQNYPIAGTLSYLAPQVMKGILCDKSDLWSCGVLMYILLTGISPFKGKNQLQTKENINSKELNYKTSPLNLISQQAKDLLQKLLNRNMYKRVSAIQALSHPWFSKLKNYQTISITNLQKLQSYYVNSQFIQRGNNLISVIESYLSLRKITQEERQKLAQIFTRIDSDGNGLIQRSELIQILKDHFKSLEEKEIDGLVESIDKNSSGKIDFNEFIIAMYDKDKLYVRQSLSEAFEYFDKDHTGFIEMEELRSILNGGDAAEVEYFIDQIDQDNDRKISKEEFIQYLLSY